MALIMKSCLLCMFLCAAMLFEPTSAYSKVEEEIISQILNNEQAEEQAFGRGITYIRWGKTTCRSGAELLYDGLAAGTFYSSGGGGANYLCMPHNPQYGEFRDGVQNYSPIYGAEYENSMTGDINNYNVPCAVCYVTNRATSLMIPARLECPPSWTLEYTGYLMSERKSHRNSMFTCVDAAFETIPESSKNTNGALFYHTEANCNGLPCELPDPEATCDGVPCEPYDPDIRLSLVFLPTTILLNSYRINSYMSNWYTQ